MSDTNDFYKNYKQNLDAIDICVKSNLIFPALTLIYSSIDVMAWMAFGDITVRDRYIKWVGRWMLNTKTLSITPLELYAARCAILHRLSPDSDISIKGHANIIVYAYGREADINAHKEVMANRTVDNQSFLHLDDLVFSFKNGVQNFYSELDSNEELQQGFIGRRDQAYEHISIQEMESFL